MRGTKRILAFAISVIILTWMVFDVIDLAKVADFYFHQPFFVLVVWIIRMIADILLSISSFVLLLYVFSSSLYKRMYKHINALAFSTIFNVAIARYVFWFIVIESNISSGGGGIPFNIALAMPDIMITVALIFAFVAKRLKDHVKWLKVIFFVIAMGFLSAFIAINPDFFSEPSLTPIGFLRIFSPLMGLTFMLIYILFPLEQMEKDVYHKPKKKKANPKVRFTDQDIAW